MKSLGLERIDVGVLPYLQQVVNSGQWCRYYDRDGVYQNGMVSAFEAWACSFYNRQHALATTSATQALHVALTALGVAGKEVILPAYAFTACAVSIICAGATPVVAPIDATLSLDADAVEAMIGDRTAGIMAVHMRGLPTNMPRIAAIAERYSIPVIEDCSQFDGLTIDGQPAGSRFSSAAVFSFQARKVISAGEGGLILTDREKLHRSLFRLHDSAWFMRRRADLAEATEEFPFLPGCRMNEITAAVLLYQSEGLSDFLTRLRFCRKILAKRIDHAVPIAPMPTESEAGGTLALLAPDPKVAHIWVQRLRAALLHIYPESANPHDAHFVAGWPESILAHCRLADDLDGSYHHLMRTVLIQVDPNWTPDDLDVMAEIILSTTKGS